METWDCVLRIADGQTEWRAFCCPCLQVGYDAGPGPQAHIQRLPSGPSAPGSGAGTGSGAGARGSDAGGASRAQLLSLSGRAAATGAAEEAQATPGTEALASTGAAVAGGEGAAAEAAGPRKTRSIARVLLGLAAAVPGGAATQGAGNKALDAVMGML